MMENDGRQNEEKKQGKHMQFVCLSFATRLLFPRKPKKRTNLEQDDQLHTKGSRSSQHECY